MRRKTWTSSKLSENLSKADPVDHPSPPSRVMPLINLCTSLPSVDAGEDLLQLLSSTLAEQTGKPEAYVMTLLQTGVSMTFAGTTEPAAYVEIKSIGALRPQSMAATFCTLIQEHTGIPASRIYIGFDDVPASLWGWKGSTFG